MSGSEARNRGEAVIQAAIFGVVSRLLLRPAVETVPEELKLAVHLRGHACPCRWMLGCKPSRGRGDFNR